VLPTTTPPPNLLFRTFVLSSLAGRLLADVAAECGLRAGELAVQGAIHAWGPLTPTELARITGLAPTTLSAYIRRMDDRGHVRRAPNPHDGRSYLLELTDEGVAAVKTFGPGLRLRVQAIDAALGEPQASEARATFGAVEQAMRELLDRDTAKQ
jgi:DNA-binding MarR family transcriptional regulator